MRHMYVPDTQVKPGQSVEHLTWAGKYAVEMRPEVIVLAGDWWDMPSLSSYDKGKKSFEGRRYLLDIEAGNHALDVFMAPIVREQKRLRKNKKPIWKPRIVFTEGNHEYRMHRAVEDDAMLEGLVSIEDTNLDDYSIECYPFLEVVVIDGIAYSHFFTSGVMGRPVSSARLMLTKKFMSCVMGHVQQRDIAFATRADGKRMTGIFGGVYSPHHETYLNPQTNEHWRGLWIFNEVEDGQFDELPVSINYLEKKYG